MEMYALAPVLTDQTEVCQDCTKMCKCLTLVFYHTSAARKIQNKVICVTILMQFIHIKRQENKFI